MLCTKLVWFQESAEDLQLIVIDTVNVKDSKQETVQNVLNGMEKPMCNGKPKVLTVQVKLPLIDK